MKDFSVPMALVDFIPVIFFTVSAIILQRDLYHRMSKGAFALFAAGTIDIICAGALKALYKLLYAAGICDFARLSDMFFPVQSIGFKKFIWFISIGYGFSVAGIGVAMLIMFRTVLSPVLVIMTLLFIVYGCRLGGYLLIREAKSTSYQNTMKNDIKDGSDMKLIPMLAT